MSALRDASAALDEALARTPWEHHVLWTGAAGSFRRGSLASRCLSVLDVPGELVRLRWLMQRAAEREPAVAHAPGAVRDALRMHQKAKPAVYLLLERAACGTFHAVSDIPFAGGMVCRLQAGDPVVDRHGRILASLGSEGRAPGPTQKLAAV